MRRVAEPDKPRMMNAIKEQRPPEEGQDVEAALSLGDLIEKKLCDFVRKSKDGKNLYHLLLPAFEKPLIQLALRESEWNQIRAAQMLGLHRNTLRKKIKELKIAPEE
jgi:DNA-binding protein Fis